MCRNGCDARLEQSLQRVEAIGRRHCASGADCILAGLEGGGVKKLPRQLAHGHVHVPLAQRVANTVLAHGHNAYVMQLTL